MTAGRPEAPHLFLETACEESGPGPRVAVKDLIDVQGMVTTGGGQLLPTTPAQDDATVVARARAAGAVLVGKANLDEWGLDTTGANPHYGDVVHPYDSQRIPGGSSGACAAAVALGLCDWAIGSDTAGSIRIPASLCGVVGVRPSTGVLPTKGMLPVSPTLDTPGPLARDVATATYALETMAGELPGSEPALDGLRIAAPAGWADALDPPVARAWSRVARDFPEVSLPSPERFAPLLEAIVLPEAAAQHRTWLETRPQHYGRGTRELLRAGLEPRAADYIAACRQREQVADELDTALASLDALVLPATPCVAPLRDEPTSRRRLGLFTTAWSLTGRPVVSLPLPVRGGLPAGAQVVSARGEDRCALAVAAWLERTWRDATAVHSPVLGDDRSGAAGPTPSVVPPRAAPAPHTGRGSPP